MRRVIRELVPPLLWRAVSRDRTAREATPAVVMEVPDRDPRALNYVIGSPVFDVPLARLRYTDGRRFTAGEHHFLGYYASGLPALRRFFETHQPTNMFEMYFLTARRGHAPPADGCPWLWDARGVAAKGEVGLGPEHGDQMFGPVSEEKLRLEASRLDRVLASIARLGFAPNMGGYPQGYFMVRGDGEWVFTVRGGFHRVAAMAHLGYDTVRVQFFPHYPRIVEEARVEAWPMVDNGQLSVADALAMFGQFFVTPLFEAPW